MSEQTPDSAASADHDEDFSGPDSEPSMEDILASIRKIIADDADPVPLDGPEGELEEEPALAAQTLATKTAAETVSARDDLVQDEDDFDLDALLGDLGADLIDEDADVAAITARSVPAVENPVSIAMDKAEEPEEPVSLEAPDAIAVDTVADEMDQLMDELMGGLDVITDTEVDPASTLPKQALPHDAALSEAVSFARITPEQTSEEDLDLVKSLMADLTDEDATPEIESFDIETIEIADEHHPVTGEEPAVEEDVSETDEDDLDALEGDILDSIMDMTLGDETAAFQSDESDLPDLSQIADAAEADATVPQPAAKQDPEPKPAQSDPQKLERPMPSALRSDALLDNVTEKATMSAFAELNQVVEDQAVLSERGPRIGDLVQEALKPMIKEWLDENIQGIVERAVAKEVKRIAAGK